MGSFNFKDDYDDPTKQKLACKHTCVHQTRIGVQYLFGFNNKKTTFKCMI